MLTKRYEVQKGPEGYLPPAAAMMGIVPSEPGTSLVEGQLVLQEAAMEKVADALLQAKNPVFFPGPLILWAWKEGVEEKAQAIKELAEAAGAKIIPMPDYRPKYPMINPEIEINPNHPNLTIWHNNIDVCLFVGVHCHYANIALKLIRGGTDCYTIALCAEAGHEDAMISLRDVGLDQIRQITEIVKKRKETQK